MEKINLLYVEDEENLHFLFGKILPEQYQLFSALDGREALRILRKHKDIAIVVSDHRMPGMTGVELMAQVYEKYPETIRILLTAYGDREIVLEAINRGHVFHYLQKPWEENELLLILHHAVKTYLLAAENSNLTRLLAAKNKTLEAELVRRKAIQKDLQDKEKHVRLLTRELIMAQEKERQMIGLELHDNVAQVLSSLKLIYEGMLDDVAKHPENLKKWKLQVVNTLQQSINSVRELSYNLQPPALSQFGLVDALRQYSEETAKRHKLRLEFYADKGIGLDLPYDTSINLYRLGQEAINNSCKHGEATWLQVELRCVGGVMILSVVDDGKGFDFNKRMERALIEKRMGLRSMEERVGLLRGNLSIDTAPGKGCVVRAEVPL
jgi:signal transduction histidine kinase